MSDPYRSTAPSPGLWLGLSIAATLFCCTPLGIVGIVFSAMAMDANSRGDAYLAEERTQKAKSWTLWAIGAGVVIIVLYICLLANGTSSSNY